MTWDLVGKKIQDINKEVHPLWTSQYTRNRGEPGLCKALAKYMEEYWMKTPVDWEGVCIQNGCGSSIETLGHLITNPGDTIIVPGPFYSKLPADYWTRLQTRLQVAHTKQEDNYEPTRESLEAAYKIATEAGSRVKAL